MSVKLTGTVRQWDSSRPGGLNVVDVPTAVEDLLRDLAPQVLGLLVRRYDDFTDTEDALQRLCSLPLLSGRFRVYLSTRAAG